MSDERSPLRDGGRENRNDDRGTDPARDDPDDDIASRVTSATATLSLDDGRTLAYAEFGDPGGDPVFVFHGGIGSRGFGLLFDDAARRTGIRVVSPDRPGYGQSDPDPGRTLLDWPDDVATLADDLDLDRFALLGVSGGGPYAAACAYALPERVTAAALVSSIGPPGSPKSLGLRVLSVLARVSPWPLRFPLGRQLRLTREDPDAAIERRSSGAAEPEAAMHHGEAGRILNASTAEAGRQGPAAAAREVALVGGPWGFPLEAIEAPVGVWHGSLDRTIPEGIGRYFADAIPDARLTVHDDVGHLSLPVNYAEEVLGFLVDAGERPLDGDGGS